MKIIFRVWGTGHSVLGHSTRAQRTSEGLKGIMVETELGPRRMRCVEAQDYHTVHRLAPNSGLQPHIRPPNFGGVWGHTYIHSSKFYLRSINPEHCQEWFLRTENQVPAHRKSLITAVFGLKPGPQ